MWAVDEDDSIIIRTDVVPHDCAGKKWKLLQRSPTAAEVDLKTAKEGDDDDRQIRLLSS